MSYSEAKGFIILLAVSVLALLMIFFPKAILRSRAQIDGDDIEKLDSLVAILESSQSVDSSNELFHFNPNLLPVDSLILLGFSEKIAQRLDNYRTKGGRFVRKVDVKKIYGLSQAVYLSIEPYISLPDTIVAVRDKGSHFDINTVTEVELLAISGIGNTLAGRIIRYREILGGFITLDQLEEVYQLGGPVLDAMKNQGIVRGGFQPKKVKINHATLEELMKHPYISSYLAEDIVRFRDINGAIESEKLLASFKSVDKGNFEKLISYLDFQ